MRKFLLFPRMKFHCSQTSTTSLEIELTTPTPYMSAIPDGDYFSFLQRTVDESISTNQYEGKSCEHVMNHVDYSKYWRKKMHTLDLLPEPPTKYSSGRSDAEVVTGYMASCYDHQLNTQLSYNLKQCLKAYNADHMDMAIQYADLFQHYIDNPEQPLPNIHWQPVRLLQVMLLCKKQQTDQAKELLVKFYQQSQDLDPDDLNIRQQLRDMIDSKNFNQLDELIEELTGPTSTINHTQLQIEAYANLNLQAAIKLNAFAPQKRQIIRLCNIIACNQQHPNDIIRNPLEFERQLIRIAKQNRYLGNLLVALFQYQQFSYYNDHQKKQGLDIADNEACQLYLRQAIDSLQFAQDAHTDCLTVTCNDMNFCHRDKNDFYFQEKQLEKHKQCCLFKIDGDIATTMKHLEEELQQRAKESSQIITPQPGGLTL
ncbi:MAG: hypothetical protein P1U63_11145 [Coxiellaceae bacterium]|nr:hypothetical protein [Coxiellaceae bacterium]